MEGARRSREGPPVISLAVVLATILSGCASTVSLDPGAQFVPPSPIQVPLTVGVYHSSELRAYTHEARPRVAASLVFPLGDATVRLLDALYPSVFARAVSVDGRPPLAPSAPRVDAVLEPAIERFDLSTGPFVAGRALAWAEVTYRFTAWSPAGQRLASWMVTGTGEAATGGRAWEAIDRSLATALERAMRDAAHKWLTSFFYVPEARRWARGLSADDATAPEAEQATTSEGIRARASYADVVILEGEFDATTPGVLSVKLRVTNEGRRRLFVRPDDVTLRLGQNDVRAAPASALAVALTPVLGRVPPVPPFAGVGTPGIRAMGAANLVGGLINLALILVEQRAFDAALTRYRQEELRDVTLWEEASTEFTVHFLLPKDAGAAQVVVLPVVDIERAVRYIVRLPVPEEGRRSP